VFGKGLGLRQAARFYTLTWATLVGAAQAVFFGKHIASGGSLWPPERPPGCLRPETGMVETCAVADGASACKCTAKTCSLSTSGVQAEQSDDASIGALAEVCLQGSVLFLPTKADSNWSASVALRSQIASNIFSDGNRKRMSAFLAKVYRLSTRSEAKATEESIFEGNAVLDCGMRVHHHTERHCFKGLGGSRALVRARACMRPRARALL
jgi:hypothetical protein